MNGVLNRGLLIHKLFDSAQMTVCNVKLSLWVLLNILITVCLVLGKFLPFCLKIHLSNNFFQNKVKYSVLRI